MQRVLETGLRIPRALCCLVALGAVLLLSACTGGGNSASKATPSATATPTGSTVAEPSSTNAPWYPSLEAFEHYNSGRDHVFPLASFGGSFHGPNTVALVRSRK